MKLSNLNKRILVALLADMERYRNQMGFILLTAKMTRKRKKQKKSRAKEVERMVKENRCENCTTPLAV